MTLRAFRKDGREVRPGDTVTNFRGAAGTFERATRAPDAGRTGKVMVSGGETYMTVWDLEVREVDDAAELRAESAPAITRAGDAEIRVFRQAPGTDDASDMYVMEVLGVTALVRLVQTENGPEPRIMIEARGQFAVGVNDVMNDYGDGS